MGSFFRLCWNRCNATYGESVPAIGRVFLKSSGSAVLNRYALRVHIEMTTVGLPLQAKATVRIHSTASWQRTEQQPTFQWTFHCLDAMSGTYIIPVIITNNQRHFMCHFMRWYLQDPRVFHQRGRSPYSQCQRLDGHVIQHLRYYINIDNYAHDNQIMHNKNTKY